MNDYAYPRGHVLYRKLRHRFPCAVRAEGIYIYDSEGRRYIDASGGAIVTNLGHGNRTIAEAIGRQAAQLAYVSGMQFTHEPVEELASALCALAPPGLDKAFFLASGTEATEAAMKLARQYWLAKGVPSRHKIISRMPSYHGNTLGALSVGGRRANRIYFEPLFVDHPKIPAPICYRCPWQRSYPGCDYECARELENALQLANPGSVAAFLVEPILGSTGCAMVPPPDYYRRTQEICRKYDLLFIADEILCGMGRTGDWFAINSYGVSPDVVLVGKGLAGGYLPISAMITRQSIIDVIYASGVDFLHHQTFAHHPVGCAAALATIRFIQEHDLLRRCREMGAVLHEKISQMREHPLVGDVRGRGLLAGFELISDKVKREPFDRSWKVAERVREHALAHGLIVWTNVGHVDGLRGDAVMLAPPFIVTVEQLDEIVARLAQTFDEVAAELYRDFHWQTNGRPQELPVSPAGVMA